MVRLHLGAEHLQTLELHSGEGTGVYWSKAVKSK